LIIEDVRVDRTGGGNEVSARLGDFRCCYRFPPGALVNATGDAFLAAGLLAAMVRNEPLTLSPPLTASPTLLSGLARLQEIFSVWVPRLSRVSVVAHESPPPPARPQAAAFFSGGADSLYTLLDRREEISHALHIRGFDYRRERRDLVDEIDRRNREFVEGRRLQLTVVESNLRELYDELGVHVFLYHGSHLASVGLAAGFERVYVPASFTWADLLPWGSHPLTDPLWSNGAVEFVPHGMDAGRLDKLRRIGEDPDALALLRVCPGFTRYSCGVCEKCLRTRVGLRLLGLRSPNLKPLGSPWPVARLRVDSERSRVNWSENWRLARRSGDRALTWALSACLVRYELRRALQSVDEMLLGGRLQRTARFLKRAIGRHREDPGVRIDDAPPPDPNPPRAGAPPASR